MSVDKGILYRFLNAWKFSNTKWKNVGGEYGHYLHQCTLYIQSCQDSVRFIEIPLRNKAVKWGSSIKNGAQQYQTKDFLSFTEL